MLNARHVQGKTTLKRRIGLVLLLIAAFALAGCGQRDNMQVQAKLDEPYQESPVFGTAAREILPEAVPVGFARIDEHLYEGRINGEYATTIPIELTEPVLARGQQSYNDFCAPCHGLDGSGEGIVALEGYPQPASYHTDLLRAQPVGRLYETITEGRGVMFSYAGRIPVEDRWAVVAYVRALQLSQYAQADTLPPDVRAQLDATE